MYSLERKPYITQRADNQRDVGFNVGFVYSLYSFFATLLFTYSVENHTAYNPQNDGGVFFNTMGFISQNDAYIFWGVFIPLFYGFLLFFLVFRGSVLWLSNSFLLDFFFFSWYLFGGGCFVSTFASPKAMFQVTLRPHIIMWDTRVRWRKHCFFYILGSL